MGQFPFKAEMIENGELQEFIEPHTVARITDIAGLLLLLGFDDHNNETAFMAALELVYRSHQLRFEMLPMMDTCATVVTDKDGVKWLFRQHTHESDSGRTAHGWQRYRLPNDWKIEDYQPRAKAGGDGW